jgi:microcystin-dependent protein
MPTSKIYPFATTDTGTNLLTDVAYEADAHRVSGNQPGIARAQLVNKALKQSTLLSAALAKFISEGRGVDMHDNLTVDEIAAQLLLLINEMVSGVSPPAGYETTGMVAYFPRTTPPLNWLRCNGAAISRTTYANLFAVLGTHFGAGDGSTTFTLPDLRGVFPRGLDDGLGYDPGRTMGSLQKGTLVALDSTDTNVAVNNMRGTRASIGGDAFNPAGYLGTSGTWLATPYQYTIGESPQEFAVVRPVNVALLACIKY